MHIGLHSKFAGYQLSGLTHHSASHNSAVWKLSLTVLVASNCLLLFFLYLYDAI